MIFFDFLYPGGYPEMCIRDRTYADLMVNINKTFGEDWSLNANIGASINNIKTDELSYRCLLYTSAGSSFSPQL